LVERKKEKFSLNCPKSQIPFSTLEAPQAFYNFLLPLYVFKGEHQCVSSLSLSLSFYLNFSSHFLLLYFFCPSIFLSFFLILLFRLSVCLNFYLLFLLFYLQILEFMNSLSYFSLSLHLYLTHVWNLKFSFLSFFWRKKTANLS